MCHNRRVDFAAELRAVHGFLDARGFRSAVIGGVALASLDDKWRELTYER